MDRIGSKHFSSSSVGDNAERERDRKISNATVAFGAGTWKEVVLLLFLSLCYPKCHWRLSWGKSPVAVLWRSRIDVSPYQRCTGLTTAACSIGIKCVTLGTG